MKKPGKFSWFRARSSKLSAALKESARGLQADCDVGELPAFTARDHGSLSIQRAFPVSHRRVSRDARTRRDRPSYEARLVQPGRGIRRAVNSRLREDSASRTAARSHGVRHAPHPRSEGGANPARTRGMRYSARTAAQTSSTSQPTEPPPPSGVRLGPPATCVFVLVIARRCSVTRSPAVPSVSSPTTARKRMATLDPELAKGSPAPTVSRPDVRLPERERASAQKFFTNVKRPTNALPSAASRASDLAS
jgi:hypothetical protein